MIFTIAGAPGAGKADVAEKLRAFLNEGESSDSCYGIVQDEADKDDVISGFLLDYRSELLLAALRARNPMKDLNLIFTHSLIDSASYVALRLSQIVNHDRTNIENIERWGSTLTLILIMLEDGFHSDQTFYLPYRGEDQDSRDLDEVLVATMEQFKISYTEIDPDGEVGTWLSR